VTSRATARCSISLQNFTWSGRFRSQRRPARPVPLVDYKKTNSHLDENWAYGLEVDEFLGDWRDQAVKKRNWVSEEAKTDPNYQPFGERASSLFDEADA